MPRVVIDANVYLSALIFGGNPRAVVERTGLDFQTIISEELYVEMRRAVARKFPQFRKEYQLLELLLREVTVLVPLGSHTITVCRDPRDNYLLEAAVLGRTSYIVTGDGDLLTLKSYQKISIVTPEAFLKKLG